MSDHFLRYVPGTRYGKKLAPIRFGPYPSAEVAEQVRQECHNTGQLEVVDEHDQAVPA